MSITKTATARDFTEWLATSSNYKNNFSYEGAIALFDYLEDLSDDMGESIEYDPIAWCCEFTEYETLDEIRDNYTDIKALDDLRDYTQVIEFDGGIIIQNF